jgi:hypothetical protein
LPARNEPANWKDPKAKLFTDVEKENAQQQKQFIKDQFGYGVSAPPGAQPKAKAGGTKAKAAGALIAAKPARGPVPPKTREAAAKPTNRKDVKGKAAGAAAAGMRMAPMGKPKR